VKSLALILASLSQPFRRRNGRVVVWLLAALVALVAIYSTIFHFIMEYEGRQHSWATGVYWTLTVMSTLGFGDITFESDIGRIFSVIVLISGALFILVLLPFAFIQFLFLPWMAQREAQRAPRKLPEATRDHIVLTQLGAVTDALIRRARDAHVPYVLIVADPAEALALFDQGYKVMVGDLDDPDTYLAARADAAALVATSQSDMANTNIVFTVREINATVPIIATASSEAAVDVLELAGCDTVLQMGELLGHAMARRVLGGDRRSHVVGEFDSLLVAEASVAGTELIGCRVAEADLRGRYNVSVAGIWQRGRFELPEPGTLIEESDVLILAGSSEQLAAYDEAFGAEHAIDAPVIVIGGGRVGRAAARVLGDAGARCRIVEQQAERVRDPELYVEGDAADLDVLKEAGLESATAVLITTHDDDVNVFLTIYCRRLRPDLQVISRANLDRNVATLHRAGADAVLSYASIGATSIWNTLGRNDSLVLAEGLEMFRTPVPHRMAGRSLAECEVRRRTGCNVVAVELDGATVTNPVPTEPLPADADLVVIGDSAARQRFVEAYPMDHHSRR
jgi:Trk K+ transport system NAD-binding subunit